MTCDQCGRPNPDNFVFCQDCGQRLPARGAYVPAAAPPPPVHRPEAPPLVFDLSPPGPAPVCPACRAQNPDGNRFCVSCGARMPDEGAASPGPIDFGLAQSPATAPAPAPLQVAPAPAPIQVAPAPAPLPVAPTVPPLACGRCFGDNDATLQYCQFCGAPLHAAPLPLTPASPPKPAGGGTFVLHERGTTRPETPLALAGPADTSSPYGALAPASARGESSSVAISSAVGPEARLVAIAKDGAEGAAYPLVGDSTDIGRREGQVRIAEDAYLDARHMRIYRRGEQFFVRDLGSVNGVYVRLRAPHDLANGDLILVGLQVLRFDVVNDAEQGLGPATQNGTLLFGTPILPRHGRLCQRTVEGVDRNVYYLHRDETILGREQGDIVFTHDPFLSRRHVALRRTPSTGAFILDDLGSSNGTYVAIRRDLELNHGDHVRIGQHLFRFDVAPSSNPLASSPVNPRRPS